MTRETKIGLLIGLGFIVVFAVLLSHTAEVPLATGDRGLAPAEVALLTDGLADAAVGTVADAASSVGEGGVEEEQLSLSEMIDGPAATADAWDRRLPRIDAFDPRPADDSSTAGTDNVMVTNTPPAPVSPDRVVQIVHRVAPPPAATTTVEDPAPTARPSAPAKSPKPGPTVPPTPPPGKHMPPKQYLVKKGDSLGTIAAQVYQTSAPRVVAFLYKSNKDRIKSKDLVIAGQKLVIVELPADLLEPAGNIAAGQVNAAVHLARAGQSPHGDSSEDTTPNRRAPQPALEILAKGGGTNERANGSTETARWYEIKPKDTLVSIAKRELGSSVRWREIQALNRHIKPTKMRPGVKIKLPGRQPSSGSGRAQA